MLLDEIPLTSQKLAKISAPKTLPRSISTPNLIKDLPLEAKHLIKLTTTVSSQGFFARYPKTTGFAIGSALGSTLGACVGGFITAAFILLRALDIFTVGLSLFITLPITIALFGIMGGLLGRQLAKIQSSRARVT